nr:site-specific DNA-methyltransferase [Aestuariimicrobium ganziense]
MPRYSLLLAPAANRVYAGESAALTASELALTAAFAREVAPTTIAGVVHLGFEADGLDEAALAVLATQSARLALFERVGDDDGSGDDELLRPIALPEVDWLDDDLVTIPKYPGKTNEQFTRLLLNVTLARVRTEAQGRPLDVLDPLAGRGTTLFTAWMLGHHGFGVEGDAKSVEQLSAYAKTWLRRKRLKHNADLVPVRREGKSLGRKFEGELRLPDRPTLTMGVFTGDTRDSAKLWGKKRFDAIVADAPYGVVHGSSTDVRGVSGKRDRSPAGLLGEAIPVWSRQLRAGGALGLSWNTHGLTREALAEMLEKAGLEVCTGDAWLGFAHRVDSSINRDLMVATKPV